MAMSFPLMLVPYIQKVHPFLTGSLENMFVFGGVVFLASIALMIVASLVTRPSSPEKAEALHWSLAMLRLPDSLGAAAYPWYKRVGLWWFVLGAVYVVLYVTFW